MSQANEEQISQRMRTVRGELRDDVHGVIDRARTLTDWRHYVRSHPWLFLAAGVATGFLLGPGRPSAAAGPARSIAARLVGSLAKNVAGGLGRGVVSGAAGYLATQAAHSPVPVDGSPENAQSDW